MFRTILKCALLATVGGTSYLEAQQEVSDRTTINYYRGNNQVGSDEFTVRRQELSTGFQTALRSRAVVTERGERILTEVTYDSNWRPAQLQMEIEGATPRRTWVQFGARRITYRTVSSHGESARELPGRGTLILLDDHLPSLFSVLPHLPEGPVRLFRVRTGGIEPGTLVDHGTTTGSEDGQTSLRHLEIRAEDGSRHVWFDANGRPVSVEVPTLNLRGSRETD